MSEYIPRDAAIAIIEEKQKELCPVGRYSRHYCYGADRDRFDEWQEIIDALGVSETADIEEVVRCKDCKHSTLPSELNRATDSRKYRLRTRSLRDDVRGAERRIGA